MAEEKKKTTVKGGSKRTLVIGTRPFKPSVTGENLPRLSAPTSAPAGDETDSSVVKGNTLPPQPVVKSDLGKDIAAIISGPEPPDSPVWKLRDESTNERKRQEKEWDDQVRAVTQDLDAFKEKIRLEQPAAPVRRDTPPIRSFEPTTGEESSVVEDAKEEKMGVKKDVEPTEDLIVLDDEVAVASVEPAPKEPMITTADAAANADAAHTDGAEISEEEILSEQLAETASEPEQQKPPEPEQSAAPKAVPAQTTEAMPVEPAPKEPMITTADAAAANVDAAHADGHLTISDSQIMADQSAGTAPVQPIKAAPPPMKEQPSDESKPEQQKPPAEGQQPKHEEPPAEDSENLPSLTMSSPKEVPDKDKIFKNYVLGERFTIGREEGCNIVLPATKMLPEQVVISRNKNWVYSIRNCGGVPGTVQWMKEGLLGKDLAVDVEEPLHDDDKFSVAGYRFAFSNSKEVKDAPAPTDKKNDSTAATVDLAQAPLTGEAKPTVVLSEKKTAVRYQPVPKKVLMGLGAGVAAVLIFVLGIAFSQHFGPSSAPTSPTTSLAPVEPAPAPKAPAVKPPPAEIEEEEIPLVDLSTLLKDVYTPSKDSPLYKYVSPESETPSRPEQCFPDNMKEATGEDIRNITWCCANLMKNKKSATTRDIMALTNCMLWKEATKLAAIAERNVAERKLAK